MNVIIMIETFGITFETSICFSIFSTCNSVPRLFKREIEIKRL